MQFPGNPDIIIDESEPDNRAAFLQYWRAFALEPYTSDAIGLPDSSDEDERAITQYIERMGWDKNPPNA